MTIRILSITALCFSLACFFSCEKENNPESPFFDFFNESAIVIDTFEQAGDTWEYGFTFTPLKSGNITELGLKLPSQGNFSATLWDLSGATPSVLSSKTLNYNSAHADIFSAIDAIDLAANQRFGITVRSNAFYRMRKSGMEPFSFPRTAGNIRIESFNQNINNTGMASFPISTNDTIIAPCVNVIFIAD